jgi:hypothetical protein
MKIKRNYQFIQFLLDGFALFQLYLIAACIADIFKRIRVINEAMVRVPGSEAVKMNPNPVVIWGILSAIIFVGCIILPFVTARKTKMNQKQHDYFIYGVYLIRVLALLIIFYALDIHLSFVTYSPKSLFSIQILATAVLIVIIIRFTQIRIKSAAAPKEEPKPREIVED